MIDNPKDISEQVQNLTERVAGVANDHLDKIAAEASTREAADNSLRDLINNKDSLPSQTGNSGKFLKTDGSKASWSSVDALPAQSTSTSGRFLSSNGSTASWTSVKQVPLESTSTSGKVLKSNGSSATWDYVKSTTDYVAQFNNIYSSEVSDTPAWETVTDQLTVDVNSLNSNYQTLSNRLDTQIENISSKLPLSGGTLTGTVSVPPNKNNIKTSNDKMSFNLHHETTNDIKHFEFKDLDTNYGIYLPLEDSSKTSWVRLRFVKEFNWVETGWYRIWSDGWIEQGGKITTGSLNSVNYKVTFPKAMSNSSYIVNVAVAPNTSNVQLNAVFGDTTTTGMSVYCSSNYGASYTFGWLSWHIEGIIA